MKTAMKAWFSSDATVKWLHFLGKTLVTFVCFKVSWVFLLGVSLFWCFFHSWWYLRSTCTHTMFLGVFLSKRNCSHNATGFVNCLHQNTTHIFDMPYSSDALNVHIVRTLCKSTMFLVWLSLGYFQNGKGYLSLYVSFFCHIFISVRLW